jgi:hypothetical protein
VGKPRPNTRQRDPQDTPSRGADGGCAESGAAYGGRCAALHRPHAADSDCCGNTVSRGDKRVAVCDQVRAIDKGWLTRREGQLTPADLRAVEDGVRAVLEL